MLTNHVAAVSLPKPPHFLHLTSPFISS